MSMRVFVTGATGYLGRAIAARLAQGGLEVQGLARRQERGDALVALGVKPVIGDLETPESFVADLKNCDAVVHAAARPGPEAARCDQLALETIKTSVVDGRVRRVLYTSGVWVHGDTGERIEDESSPLHPAEVVAWRPAHEEVALDLVEHEAQVSVLRPGMVYGGTGGTFGDWFREARKKKTVTYPGGDQHWNMVHLDDVAEAYRLALEHARGAPRFILVDESRYTVRELAEAVARVTGAEARAWRRAQVLERLGPVGAALLMDQRVTAGRARRELGWVPRHTSFVNEIEDLHRGWLAGEKAPVV